MTRTNPPFRADGHRKRLPTTPFSRFARDSFNGAVRRPHFRYTLCCRVRRLLIERDLEITAEIY
jgi:hypothetical protein